jgi:hypothetical protein
MNLKDGELTLWVSLPVKGYKEKGDASLMEASPIFVVLGLRSIQGKPEGQIPRPI